MPHLVYSHGVVTRGSTDPLLLADTEGRLWLTKLQPAPMLDHLAELVVAELARRLHIPTPPFTLATVDDGLAQALAAGEPREARFGAAIVTQGRSVFASLWLNRARDVTEPPPNDRELLARILALDLLVHNPDRRHDHPNLLQNGTQLLAMDHAQALPWCRGQGDTAPVWAQHVATAVGVSPARLHVAGAEIHESVATVPLNWWPSPEAREATLEALYERAARLERGTLE